VNCVNVGTEFLYSTHAFTLLSAVIEAAAGRKFTDIMKNVFRDLGLENTYFDEDQPMIPHRSRCMCVNVLLNNVLRKTMFLLTYIHVLAKFHSIGEMSVLY